MPMLIIMSFYHDSFFAKNEENEITKMDHSGLHTCYTCYNPSSFSYVTSVCR